MDYQYDVALSFAGEQRDFVRDIAKILVDEYELKVFFDEFEEEKLWGKNLYDYLYEIYSKRSKYVMIFVSKEYKEKIWTNHEREAAQEKALKLKEKEYILPVKFDEVSIPGLPSTISYIDARTKTSHQIAKLFAQKLGLNPKVRWFGYWEKESFAQAINGDLKINNVSDEGFYYDLIVMHGSYTGILEGQYAKFINQNEAVSNVEECEECTLKFIMLNKSIYIQEENCLYCHGLRASFDGKYIFKKDFFYGFDLLNDGILSKLFKLLGKKGYDNFEMCFCDYVESKENNRYFLFGSVPGFYPFYNGCLILDDNEIRGFFINCSLKDNTIFWFASDNRQDEALQKFIDENEQFKNYIIEKFEADEDDSSIFQS